MAVVKVATAQVVGFVPPEGRVFNPATTGGSRLPWGPSSARAIAAILGAAVDSGTAVLSCEGNRPDGCQIRGANSVISIERPVFDRDTALVSVMVSVKTDLKRQPVNSSLYDFVLERIGEAQWKIRSRGLSTP
jgi:hypothetical protein